MSPAPSVHQESEDALRSEGARSEASLTSSGQRNINLVWEGTQRQIALAVMVVFLLICLMAGVSQLLGHGAVEIPPSLAGVVGYVIGSYFARTNHEKVGGVGSKPDVHR